MSKVKEWVKAGLAYVETAYEVADKKVFEPMLGPVANIVAMAIVRRAMAAQKRANPTVYMGKPRSVNVTPIELTGTFLPERKMAIRNLLPTDKLCVEMCPNKHSNHSVIVYCERMHTPIGWIPEKNGVAKKYFYFLKMGKKVEIVNWDAGRRDGEHFIIYVK